MVTTSKQSITKPNAVNMLGFLRLTCCIDNSDHIFHGSQRTYPQLYFSPELISLKVAGVIMIPLFALTSITINERWRQTLMINLCSMHVPGNYTRPTNAKHLFPYQIPNHSAPLIRPISLIHRTLITPADWSGPASASGSASGSTGKTNVNRPTVIWSYSLFGCTQVCQDLRTL